MQGVIAGGGKLTAEAGKAMFEQGGNAVDATVAAAFASFIAEIGVVHLGGSGIAQVFLPETGETVVYDFFSNMPGLAKNKTNGNLDFQKVTIDFGPTTQDFHIGRGSVAVSGVIAGLCQMASDHGKLPLSTLLQPALELAQHGLTINEFQASTCRLLTPLYTYTDSMRCIFYAQNRMIAGGDKLFIPHLYETLQQLAVDGAALLYQGQLGRKFVADQAERGGLVTQADLAAYTIKRQQPIRLKYRDFEVHLPPPCSSGGVLIGFSLQLLSRFDVAQLQINSAESHQLLYEVLQATQRARQRWEIATAAPHDVDQLITHFLSDDFITPYFEQVQAAIRDKQPSTPISEKKGPNNTSHLSAIDSSGMAISMTTTAGESAGYVVPETGLIPNNMLGEADINPHGWHKWTPGRRLPTMMSPTFLVQDGQVRLVVGSGGSERIRSAILQVITNLVDHKMALSEAVKTPRVHVENNILQCELGFDEAEVARYETMGYQANRWHVPSMYFGGAHSVGMSETGILVAAGDQRRDGHVAHADT